MNCSVADRRAGCILQLGGRLGAPTRLAADQALTHLLHDQKEPQIFHPSTKRWLGGRLLGRLNRSSYRTARKQCAQSLRSAQETSAAAVVVRSASDPLEARSPYTTCAGAIIGSVL